MDRRRLLVAVATAGTLTAGCTSESEAPAADEPTDSSANESGDSSDDPDDDRNEQADGSDPGVTVEEYTGSDGGLFDVHPRITSYSAEEVTLVIPTDSLPNHVSDGGTLRIDAPYDDIGVTQLGEWEVEFPWDETEVTIEIDADEDWPGTDTYRYTVMMGSESADELLLAETDPFTFDNGDIVEEPFGHDIDPLNVDDPDATYRRDVGEGVYAVQVSGTTFDETWTVDLRFRKSDYEEVTSKLQDSFSLAVNHSFVEHSSEVTRIRPSADFSNLTRWEVDRELGSLDVSDETLVGIATDLARALPIQNDANDQFKYLPQTLVDGGGNELSLTAVAIGLIWYSTGYDDDLYIVRSNDDAVIGLASDDFDGVMWDSQNTYLLDVTGDDYVGDADEDFTRGPLIYNEIDPYT